MKSPQEIKQLRVRAGLTQQQLAAAARVSQSLIAKIEHGNVDPLYSTVQKILAVLEQYNTKMPTIDKLVCKDIVSCNANESISAVLTRLRSKNCSQLPVFDGNVVIGMVNETSLLSALLEHKKTINNALLAPPPIVPLQTPPQLISDILRASELILVSDKGKICGIISRADLLRELSKAI